MWPRQDGVKAQHHLLAGVIVAIDLSCRGQNGMQSGAKLVLHSCQMELKLTPWKHAGVLLPDLQHDAQCANAQSMQWHHITRLLYRTAMIRCLAGLSHALILPACLEEHLLLCICVYHNGQEHI